MHLIRTRNIILLVVMLALLALLGCKGDTGPMGPDGPQGDQGPQGEQGPPGEVSRSIMTGTVGSEEQAKFIQIPGLDMEDPPLITVFIDLTPPEWDELPMTLEDTQGNAITLFASIQGDGVGGNSDGVTLYNCQDLNYIIVILQ